MPINKEIFGSAKCLHAHIPGFFWQCKVSHAHIEKAFWQRKLSPCPCLEGFVALQCVSVPIHKMLFCSAKCPNANL